MANCGTNSAIFNPAILAVVWVSVGISIWQLVIVLAIVLVLFGAKRLRGVGSDLGSAIKGFKQAIGSDTPTPDSIVSPAAANREKSTRS